MNENTQAVLLLVARFSKQGTDESKPLSPLEWGRFFTRLHELDIEPAMLFRHDLSVIFNGWQDKTITLDRIKRLLDRSAAMGFSLEKWQRVGLWVMSCLDDDYPDRLKTRLLNGAPPLFFGCGNRKLINQGGIAVIGSRNATTADLTYTKLLGSHLSLQGVSVISGGARGVDEHAMLGALANQGTVVGVLADSLLTASSSSKYRQHLMNNDLALISSFYPDAKFDVGNAMARNKYIYCLADAAIVVTTSEKKGGTWTGAVENLKKGWVQLWVRQVDDSESGNAALVREGAKWLPAGKLDIEQLKSPLKLQQQSNSNNLFYLPDSTSVKTSLVSDGDTQENCIQAEAIHTAEPAEIQYRSTIALYEVFLQLLQEITRNKAMTLEELCAELDIEKSQMNAWLKRAIKQGSITKLNKPTRYQVNIERSLF